MMLRSVLHFFAVDPLSACLSAWLHFVGVRLSVCFLLCEGDYFMLLQVSVLRIEDILIVEFSITENILFGCLPNNPCFEDILIS